MIKNRVSIDERPEIATQKTRMGDWEGDTVIGKNHKGVLVTLAERVSRYVLAGHIASRHAAGVTAVTKRLLRPHKEKCHTITFDNGKEFAEHELMGAYLKADIYFAHPYSSWERGLNENSNGLLRHYFPKGMDLTDVTEEQVRLAVERLNHRSRQPYIRLFWNNFKALVMACIGTVFRRRPLYQLIRAVCYAELSLNCHQYRGAHGEFNR